MHTHARLGLSAVVTLVMACSSTDVDETSRVDSAALGGVIRYEQTSPQVSYRAPWGGTWYTNRGASFSAGSHATHMDLGAAASFSFTGTSVTWIGFRDPWSGIAKISLDGGAPIFVDTYAA